MPNTSETVALKDRRGVAILACFLILQRHFVLIAAIQCVCGVDLARVFTLEEQTSTGDLKTAFIYVKHNLTALAMQTLHRHGLLPAY